MFPNLKIWRPGKSGRLRARIQRVNEPTRRARALFEAPESHEFAAANFGLVMESMIYRDSAGELVTKQTSRVSHYTMTKDGFMLLAMGFTGKKALQN